MARATQVSVHATGDNAAPGGWFDCHLAGHSCRSPDATGAAPDGILVDRGYWATRSRTRRSTSGDCDDIRTLLRNLPKDVQSPIRCVSAQVQATIHNAEIVY